MIRFARYKRSLKDLIDRFNNLPAAKAKGDEQIVIKLVLIAVAVLLAFLFRDQIQAVLQSALTSLSASITNMISG